MKPATLTALLKQTDIFKDLDPDALALVAENMTKRRYPKGQFIFSQGDPEHSLFLIAQGLVKVFVTAETGEDMVLDTLRPPSIFGELALVDGLPQSATVEALDDTTVLILARERWEELGRSNPSFFASLLRSISGMARRLTDQASDLVFLDLYGRVAKLLARFADERGETSKEGIVLELHLSQSDIACMVGGSRQRVNQVLRSFENRGYLKLEKNGIVLKNLDLIRHRAGLE